MCEFRCDLKKTDKLFNAFQTIFDEISDLKKSLTESEIEREIALKKFKSVQDILRSTRSPSQSFSTPSKNNRHKRKKTATPPTPLKNGESLKMASLSNSDLVDELNNAAFHSSTWFDDEEIAATQLQKESPPRSKIELKRALKEINKENIQGIGTPSLSNEKTKIKLKPNLSDTVETPEKLFPIQRSFDDNDDDTSEPICASISVLNPNELSKWNSKAELRKKSTPKRLFENWQCSSVKKVEHSVPKPVNRKKGTLSLSISNHKLRQSTIHFPKNDETYCEGLSIENKVDNDTSICNKLEHKNSFLGKPNIKLEKQNLSTAERVLSTNTNAMSLQQIKQEPATEEPVNETSNDSVFAVAKDTDEIIILDDSQSSQEAFKNVFDEKCIKTNTNVKKKVPLGIYMPDECTSNRVRRDTIKPTEFQCVDCEKYYRILGRDVSDKDFIKMNGVCYKHNRNNQCPDTPPGFWNPKITDTPEDQHIETPYDYRFVKDRI